MWSVALCGAETGILRESRSEVPGEFGIAVFRIEKISWTDRVRNEGKLHRHKEERNILHIVKIMKVNRIGHSWRGNCFLKHVTEGKREG